jgi:K+-transporting ATPase ATPase A chain
VIILALAKPMGTFMAKLFAGQKTLLHPVIRPLEKLTYKLIGVNEASEQRWTQYTGALIAFSIFSFLFVYVLQRLQGVLPLNPQGFNQTNVTPDSRPSL